MIEVSKNTKWRIINSALVVSIVLAIVVALYALFLLANGQQVIVVQEVPEGNMPPYGITTFESAPYPAAVIPLGAAIFLLGGLLTKKLWIAWIGLGVLLTFSILFLFSSGAAFLPIAGILLILIIIFQFSRKGPF